MKVSVDLRKAQTKKMRQTESTNKRFLTVSSVSRVLMEDLKVLARDEFAFISGPKMGRREEVADGNLEGELYDSLMWRRYGRW